MRSSSPDFYEEYPHIEELINSSLPADELLDELRQENLDLDWDPEFKAGYIKAQFVQDIYQAMNDLNISKSDLAKKLGKSRQYVGRFLNENMNFTIDSMVAISCALRREFVLRMLSPSETFKVFKTIRNPVKAPDFQQKSLTEVRDVDFLLDKEFGSKMPTLIARVPDEQRNLAA